MSALDDLDAMIKAIRDDHYRPSLPLLSLVCDAEHHHRCRSAICECRCHWAAAGIE